MVYESNLYHHGIKGQKWGVRRYQNKDGSLTSAGKKRYSTSTDSSEHKRGLTDKQKKYIVIGASAVAATMLVAGAMYVNKKSNFSTGIQHIKFGEKIDINKLDSTEKVLSKGTKLHRISSKSVEDYAEDGRRIYASYLKQDNRLYKEGMPRFIKSWTKQGIIDDDGGKAYEHILKTSKDIKILPKKKMAELYMEVTKSEDVDSGWYKRFAENLCNSDNADTKQFFKRVRELGYDAVIDEHDAGTFTKSPLILINPKDSIESSKSHKIGKLESVINVLLM